MSRRRLSGVARAGFTVLVGSALGYGLGLAVTPFLSRLYTPQEFGSFSALVAVTGLFSGVSTFRLEVLAQRVSSSNEAAALIRSALLSAAAWGGVITLTVVVLRQFSGLDATWLAVGLLVTLASLQLIGTAIQTREARYRDLAAANFVQGAGIGTLQLIGGLLSPSVWTLVAGFGGARLIWLREGSRIRWRGKLSKSMQSQAKRFAATSGLGALVNSAGTSAPIILVALAFGELSAGLLAMAIRLLVGPLSVIGQAVAAANMGEIGRSVRESDGQAARHVFSGIRRMLVLGFIPCAAAALVGPIWVPKLLGPGWGDAGVLLAILTPGALGQFAIAPFAQMVNLSGRGAWLLAWDTTRLLLISASFLVPGFLGWGLMWGAVLFSASQVLLYSVLARVCLRAVSRPIGH